VELERLQCAVDPHQLLAGPGNSEVEYNVAVWLPAPLLHGVPCSLPGVLGCLCGSSSRRKLGCFPTPFWDMRLSVSDGSVVWGRSGVYRGVRGMGILVTFLPLVVMPDFGVTATFA